MTAYNNGKGIVLCRKCGILCTAMFRCGQNYYRYQFEALFSPRRGTFSFHMSVASGNEKAQVVLQTHTIRVWYNQFFSLVSVLTLTPATEKKNVEICTTTTAQPPSSTRLSHE